MAAKSPKFLIGLFLIVGFLIGASIIVWVGASGYFEKGDLYAIYFDESVQGLQKDSVVKFRGLSIGRVADIGVAPDNRLMEVIVQITLDRDLSECSIAQLTQIGITGLVFIDMRHIAPGEREEAPRLTFTPPYPVIASRPSRLKQFETTLDRVMTKLGEVDLTGIGDRVEAVTAATERAVNSPRVERIMANLDSVMANLDRTARRIDEITAQGRIEAILAEADAGIRESRAMLRKLEEELDSLKLSDTAGKIDRSVTAIERQSRRILSDVTRSAENLNRASESLDLLLTRLEKNPSELLFGNPPPAGRSE
jgi:phospholipid/cholesterol/gamma-HCH transport system substrate-binding protein